MQHPLVRPSLAPFGFATKRHASRLDYTDRLNPYYVNAEHQMAKFWDKRHRLDAPGPLPIETIVHRILPGQARANLLTDGEFFFKGLPYLSRDIMLLSSIMYWFGTNVGSCFLEVPLTSLPRGRLGRPEYEFLVKLERDMQRRDMVAFWAHECRDECGNSTMRHLFVDGHEYIRDVITTRDRALAEGLMRWLGSTEGRVFIAAWLKRLERVRSGARTRQAAELHKRQSA